MWTVRVPASSANLGPGFDALGLAFGIYLTCEFGPAESLSIVVRGRDAEAISSGADNFIWQTARRVATNLGQTLPSIRLVIDNDIPLGKGLGSSAAALTVGVVIADRMLGLGWSRARILDEAARLEGHPDNVAACVLGSIVASAIDSDGMARAVRLEIPETFGAAVVVPDFVLPTREARAALPTEYSKADCIFNVQRSALLVAALATGNVSAFPAALEDRMHQPYRTKLVPGLAKMLQLRAPGLLGCALSGAGPSILVFFERGSEGVCELVREIFVQHGHAAEIHHAAVALDGLTIMESHAS